MGAQTKIVKVMSSVAIAFLSVACSEKVPPKQSSPLEMDVVFAGCAGVLEGPICRVKKGEETTINLWAGIPSEVNVTGSFAGAPIDLKEEKELEGRKLAVNLSGSKEGTLKLEGKTEGSSGSWELKIAFEEECPVYEEALIQREKKRFKKAITMIDKVLPFSSAYCAGKMHGLKGRILAENLDEINEGLASYENAAKSYKQAGEYGERTRDFLNFANILIFKSHNFIMAGSITDELDEVAEKYFVAKLRQSHIRSQLSFEIGAFKTGLANNSEVIKWTGRLGMSRLAIGAWQEKARVNEYLGRHGEVLVAMRSCLEEDQSTLNTSGKTAVSMNLGWALFLNQKDKASADNDNFSEAEGLLGEARTKFKEIPNPFGESIALFNLAILENHFGNHEQALEYISEAHEIEVSQGNKFIEEWLLEIEGKVQHAIGNHKRSLELFDRLSEIAVPSSEDELRATMGKARALAAMKKTKEALELHRRIEDLLDRHVKQIPVAAGQGTFLSTVEESTREHLELLLDAGRMQDALDLARRSRGRVLWELQRDSFLGEITGEKKEQWVRRVSEYRGLRAALEEVISKRKTAPSDQLASLDEKRASLEQETKAAIDNLYEGLVPEKLGPEALEVQGGELVVVFHRLTEGYAAFAVTEEGVQYSKVDTNLPLEDPRSGRELLEPFATLIDNAKTLRIVNHQDLVGVDFHAAPWGDDVLLAHLPVVYSQDLRGSGAGSQSNKLALVVSDPRSDLPEARQSLDSVSRGLKDMGYSTVSTLGQSKATRGSVESGLSKADLLHYSGHAELEGIEGWSARLLLASGQSLTVSDILSTPRVPSTVVLAACESGKTTETGPATMGLARAFLLAGSKTVVGTSRPLSDRTGRIFTELLYKSDLESVAQAARRAQLELKAKCSECDWATFRVYER